VKNVVPDSLLELSAVGFYLSTSFDEVYKLLGKGEGRVPELFILPW
jgi:hypothetical protein